MTLSIPYMPIQNLKYISLIYKFTNNHETQEIQTKPMERSGTTNHRAPNHPDNTGNILDNREMNAVPWTGHKLSERPKPAWL